VRFWVVAAALSGVLLRVVSLRYHQERTTGAAARRWL
jgi:hypothetical protein